MATWLLPSFLLTQTVGPLLMYFRKPKPRNMNMLHTYIHTYMHAYIPVITSNGVLPVQPFP